MRTILVVGLLLASGFAFVPTAAAQDCDLSSSDLYHEDMTCIPRCAWNGGGTRCATRYVECPPMC
jgi:hypothetical protein